MAAMIMAALLFGIHAAAETVKIAECERNPELDVWAAADSHFCVAVMEEVFKAAGIEPEMLPFGDDCLTDLSQADVICSAFRTRKILEEFDTPLQPIGRMHFALYAAPSRAMSMLSTKITDWPRMRVGYSPVSQGQATNDDREKYFQHANLSPEFVEFARSADAVKALHDGEIDALFLYTPFGRRPEGVVEVVPIGARNIYFAVRKDKPELLAKLSAAYRKVYIDEIDKIDEWREQMLGIPKPKNRVRIAAYSRGDLFSVTPDGERGGQLELWAKTLCAHTPWILDYVYGGYDESLQDVMDGRLDFIGGVGYAPTRRDKFLYPHTSIGMLRVYLWTHPGNSYKPGEPSTWKGMRVGMLHGTVSAARAKRQFDREKDLGITYREFNSDRAMLRAYFAGEVDACVDVEMPELADECALHVYASHPMYICTALNRVDLFEQLESAMEEICDDYPKYLRMISEHHYGHHNELAALTLPESEWLHRRAKNVRPIAIDFSPWPFQILDRHGRPTGFVGALLAELTAKTGLPFAAQQQTGITTAEAKFLRGETDLWVPWPSAAKEATYGATSVFSIPVPNSVAQLYGAEDEFLEFELFAKPNVPAELVSILRKTVGEIESVAMQDMFMRAAAERTIIHRVFGMTSGQMAWVVVGVALAVSLAFALYGAVMVRLLRREAARANKAALLAEDHAQAKTRFLALMSHELRTPLNAVIGFAEFMKKGDTTEAQRKDYIEGIDISSKALLGLINDILDITKLETGAMDMRSGVCNMDDILREITPIFGYRVSRRGVKLEILRKDASIPLLRLSHQGMRQILINLVGNASKFTEKGSITVLAEWIPDTRTLHLEVKDTGVGISDAKMAKLFDQFAQDIASRMTSGDDENRGTGLGLPIVKRLVDSAGGTIHVESELGKGSAFTIDIPGLEIVGDAKAEAPAGDTPLPAAVPDRVLVVDDMSINRKILGIHLRNLGVKDIRDAGNGVEAIKVMSQWKPDLVLSDMWMPEMDGAQLAMAMKRDPGLAGVPIVAVTADIDVGATHDMSHFAKVMAKPVTQDKLQELFRNGGR